MIQVRDVAPGETVGYGAAWTAARPAPHRHRRRRLRRRPAARARPAAASRSSPARPPCPLVGRVSMDLITVDVTDLPEVPDHLEILNARQTVDDLAARRRHHRLRDPDQPWRSLRTRLQGGRPAPGPRMILLRLAYAFLASIGRSTLGLLGATGRLTIFAAPRGLAARPPALLPGRVRPAAPAHRLLLAAGRRPDRALHRRGARAADLVRRRPLQRRHRGALDRRHRHRPRARPGPRRPDGRRPRLLLDRRRARHHARHRADRRADHALHRPDEVPGAAARPRRHARAAGAGRGRQRHRHLRRLPRRHHAGSASTPAPTSRTPSTILDRRRRHHRASSRPPSSASCWR